MTAFCASSFCARTLCANQFCTNKSLQPRRPTRPSRSRFQHARIPLRTATRANLNPYEELGLSPSAESAEIKRAYRRVALERHPDVSKEPDARERFQRAQDAYRMLSDPKSRAAYDRVARGSSSWGGSGGAGYNEADTKAAREYARKWRADNPMPEDLNDSLGSVLSDLFGGVRDGAPSVLSDVMDFFERGAGATGAASSPRTASADALGADIDEVLRTASEDVLEAEMRELARAADARDAMYKGALEDAKRLDARARDWERRARNLDSVGDLTSRDAARTMIEDIGMQQSRLEKRADMHRQAAAVARALRTRVEDRLRALSAGAQHGAPAANGSTDDSSSSTLDMRARQREKRRSVDEELERMKREMGL